MLLYMLRNLKNVAYKRLALRLHLPQRKREKKHIRREIFLGAMNDVNLYLASSKQCPFSLQANLRMSFNFCPADLVSAFFARRS